MPSDHVWVRRSKTHRTQTPRPLLTPRRYKHPCSFLHAHVTLRLRPRAGCTTRWSCPGCPLHPTCPRCSTCPPWTITITTTTITTTTLLPLTLITITWTWWTCPCTMDPRPATTDASNTHSVMSVYSDTHTHRLSWCSSTFHFSAVHEIRFFHLFISFHVSCVLMEDSDRPLDSCFCVSDDKTLKW